MAIPQSIGEYRVIDRLGRGGMGTVYKVRAPDGRFYALKLLSRNESEHGHRFKREFRAASRLRHDNIVAVHEIAEAPQPFFTMEYVEGTDLLSFLHEGERGKPLPRPEGERKLFFAIGQILKALDYIHAQGIVHRDLKPDNILVNREGAVKITDFGLAKMHETTSFVTAFGTIMGTLKYAAPEQLAGLPVDARTDLYSFGVIVYEALTGHLPITGTSMADVVRAKLSDTVPAPPSSLNPGLDPNWDTITLRLLARDPAQRHQSIPDLLAELRRLWKSAGKGAAPVPTAERLRTAKRNVLTAPRFVGRSGEREKLAEHIKLAAAGKPSLLLITGEAGIGKTALVGELRALARPRNFTVVAAPAPLKPIPFGHFLPVLDRLVDRIAPWEPADTRAALSAEGQALLYICPRLNRIRAVRELPPPPALPPQKARDRELRVMTSLLLACARRGGIVLALEDLHKVDEASLALIENLAALFDRSAPSLKPLVVVGTYRDEEVRQGDPFARFAATVEPARLLRLARLGHEEAAELIASMTGGVLPSAAALDRILRHTEGNPLFLEQTVRALAEQGAIEMSRGHWRFVDELVARHLPGKGAAKVAPVPEGIARIFADRVERLSAKTLRILEVGAVAGDHFVPEVVIPASGLAEPAALDALDEALRHRILAEPARGSEAYAFQQTKLREVILSGMDAKHRARLHAAVAAALEQTGRGGVEDLANHYDLAGDLARSARYLPAAARALASRFENAAALESYRRAIAALTWDPLESTCRHASLSIL